MGEGDWNVVSDDIGMAQTSASGSTFENDDMSTNSGLCEGLVAEVLGKIRTRPGPDEEVVIQIIAHKRPLRGRGIRDVRFQSE